MTIEQLQLIWDAEATLKNYLSYQEKLSTENKTLTNYVGWSRIITDTKDKLIKQLAATKLNFTKCKNLTEYLQILENAKYSY